MSTKITDPQIQFLAIKLFLNNLPAQERPRASFKVKKGNNLRIRDQNFTLENSFLLIARENGTFTPYMLHHGQHKRAYKNPSNLLGTGAFSRVKVTESESGKQYAVKILPPRFINHTQKQKLEQKRINAEVTALRKMKRLKEYTECSDSAHYGSFMHNFHVEPRDAKKQKNYIIMPKFSGKTLAKQHRYYKVNQIQALQVALTIAKQVLQLHQKKLIHRDIAGKNIVTLEGQAKLIDFGEVTATDSHLDHDVGSPFYMAPEVMIFDPYFKQFVTDIVDQEPLADHNYDSFCKKIDDMKTVDERAQEIQKHLMTAYGIDNINHYLFQIMQHNQKPSTHRLFWSFAQDVYSLGTLLLFDLNLGTKQDDSLYATIRAMRATHPENRPAINRVIDVLQTKLNSLQENHRNFQRKNHEMPGVAHLQARNRITDEQFLMPAIHRKQLDAAYTRHLCQFWQKLMSPLNHANKFLNQLVNIIQVHLTRQTANFLQGKNRGRFSSSSLIGLCLVLNKVRSEQPYSKAEFMSLFSQNSKDILLEEFMAALKNEYKRIIEPPKVHASRIQVRH